jgi:NADH:ubiquinone reductase (H+-translocating)
VRRTIPEPELRNPDSATHSLSGVSERVSRIVIVGGGTAGLALARALRFAPVQVILVDRSGEHLFHSSILSAALGKREPRGLRQPLARLLRGQPNCEVVQAEAIYIDPVQRRLVLSDRSLVYDILVMAAGSGTRFPRPEWARFMTPLRTPEDAAAVRRKLRDRDTTVIVVGGGRAGVEASAAIARMDRKRRVVLVEEGQRILRSYPESMAAAAERALEGLDVEICCGMRVADVDADGVRVLTMDARQRLLSRAVLWMGGMHASLLSAVLRREVGATLDAAGRVRVMPDLSIAEHPEIFVIGDMARVDHEGQALDCISTVASQEARYVAGAIRDRLAGYAARPFEYVDQGRFARVGREVLGTFGDRELPAPGAWLAAKLAEGWRKPTTQLFSYLPAMLPGRGRSYSAATGSNT